MHADIIQENNLTLDLILDWTATLLTRDQKLSVQIQDGGWMPYWKTASLAKNWQRKILYDDSKPDISNAQTAKISNYKNSIWRTNRLIWMKLCKISQTSTITKISQIRMPDVKNTFRAQLCYRHMICATSKKQKIIHQHIEIICHNAATILFDSQLAPFSRRDCAMHIIVRSKRKILHQPAKCTASMTDNNVVVYVTNHKKVVTYLLAWGSVVTYRWWSDCERRLAVVIGTCNDCA